MSYNPNLSNYSKMTNEKPTKKEMLKILLEQIQLVGYDNLNFSQLEREYMWYRTTLRKWAEKILITIPDDILLKEKGRVYHSFIGNKKVLGRLKLMNLDPEVILKIIDQERKLCESQAKVWEAFGLKDKLADKLDISWKDEVKKIVKPPVLKWNKNDGCLEPNKG